jgi:sugar O-acyltransferase (sialic acid O-acetyltransferase NeuD family)
MQQKSYILWGSSGQAIVLSDLIQRLGGRVVALFDNNLNARSALPDVELFYGDAGFESWCRGVDNLGDYFGLAAIGGGRGSDRVTIHRRFKELGIQVESVIHPDATVSKTSMIGLGCQILAQSTIAPFVRIGQGGIVNHGAVVDHECQLGDGVHVAPGATLCGCILVEDNVFIGAGSTILPRVRLGRNCTVGAGAVVTKDVPPFAVVVGNPGRIVKFIS